MNLVLRLSDFPQEGETQEAQAVSTDVNGILYSRYVYDGRCWIVFYFAGAEFGAVTWHYLGSDSTFSLFPLSVATGSGSLGTVEATVYGIEYSISVQICE